MPNRHATKPKAVRMPGGLEARVRAAAEADGETVNAFIVAAIEEKLQRREGGSTRSVAPVKRSSTTAPRGRTPRADTAPPVKLREPVRAAGPCPHRVRPGAYCKTCERII